MSNNRLLCAWLALGLLAATGCQFVSKNQLTACEAKNRSLSEQHKAQLAEIANLKAHSRTIEDQLIKAEEELALVEERTGVDRKRLANYEYERDQVGQQLNGLIHGASTRKPIHDHRLMELCKRYPALKYDPQTGLCKLDADILFTSGEAGLTPESRRQLDEFARLLKSAEAREFRVMVVGHTDNRPVAKRDTRDRFADNWHLSAARALNVADYLQHQGLREDQVGVAGYGRHQPIARNDSATTRELNRRVEIFVTGHETPIVGWSESATGLYR